MNGKKLIGLALLVSLALPVCKKEEKPVIKTEPTPVVQPIKIIPSETDIGNLWAKIYWDNQHVVKESGNLIYPGMELDINGETYVVEKGDDLWKIAEYYANR